MKFLATAILVLTLATTGLAALDFAQQQLVRKYLSFFWYYMNLDNYSNKYKLTPFFFSKFINLKLYYQMLKSFLVLQYQIVVNILQLILI